MKPGDTIWFFEYRVDSDGRPLEEFVYESKESEDLVGVQALGSWSRGTLLFWGHGHIPAGEGVHPWPVAVVLQEGSGRTRVLPADKLSISEPKP